MPNQRDDDYRYDPIGTLRREVDGLNEYYQNEQDRRELEDLNHQELSRQAAHRRETHAWARDQVQRYSQANPEYSEAFSWILEREGNKLARYGLTPDEINRQLNFQAESLFEMARTHNKNPADLVFQTAVDHGFRPTGKWVSHLSDSEFDNLWAQMESRDRTERYYGNGRPRQTSREGIPISTPEEEAGGLEDWLWKRSGSGKRR